MSDDGARPPSGVLRTVRDATLLLLVAVALVAGLVHYGGRLHAQDDRADAPSTAPAPAPSPSENARLKSGSPTAPVVVTPTVACWDGRAASSLSGCTLPRGTAGLRWVYPSLRTAGRASCHREPRPGGAYRTLVGWECFGTAAGRPVAITYEQVASARVANRAVRREYVGARRFTIPGAHGGQCTWFDATGRPVRVAGVYPRFPYVVSLYAPTPQVAKTAWAALVRQRPPQAIRGLPA